MRQIHSSFLRSTRVNGWFRTVFVALSFILLCNAQLLQHFFLSSISVFKSSIHHRLDQPIGTFEAKVWEVCRSAPLGQIWAVDLQLPKSFSVEVCRDLYVRALLQKYNSSYKKNEIFRQRSLWIAQNEQMNIWRANKCLYLMGRYS